MLCYPVMDFAPEALCTLVLCLIAKLPSSKERVTFSLLLSLLLLLLVYVRDHQLP